MINSFKIISGTLILASFMSLNAKEIIHDRCIIQLKDNINALNVNNIAKGMSEKANASLEHVYSNSIKGFSINIPCFAAQTIFGDNENIQSFEYDSKVTMSKRPSTPDNTGSTDTTLPPQEISYGTTRVGGPFDGTGKTAWIIDSGIDTKHPDLNVDKTRGFTLFRSIEDENGHGTHVAGIIGAIDNTIGTVGVAQNATLIPVRVLDRRGSGSVSGVLAGIDFVAGNAKAGDCVNLSLGGGISSSLDNAILNAAQKSGAFFTIAAGNESDDANNHSPARVNGTNIYTISAIDGNDTFAYFSNYGNPPIDYAAPGVDIISTWKGGGTNTISGTSMAAPHACGALLATNGNVSSNGNAYNDADGTTLGDPIIFMGQ